MTQSERVLNALWPVLGGNHMESEEWKAVSDAVHEALSVQPQGEAGELADELEDHFPSGWALGANLSDYFFRRILRALRSLGARAAEPVAYRYRFSDPMSGRPVWRFSSAQWNGQRPSEAEPLYARPATADEALEQAARAIDDVDLRWIADAKDTAAVRHRIIESLKRGPKP